jgi:heme exporter protein D
LNYYGSTYVPLAFQVPGYLDTRRKELKEILQKDRDERQPHEA